MCNLNNLLNRQDKWKYNKLQGYKFIIDTFYRECAGNCSMNYCMLVVTVAQAPEKWNSKKYSFQIKDLVF